MTNENRPFYFDRLYYSAYTFRRGSGIMTVADLRRPYLTLDPYFTFFGRSVRGIAYVLI